jgi:hypothetical protein
MSSFPGNSRDRHTKMSPPPQEHPHAHSSRNTSKRCAQKSIVCSDCKSSASVSLAGVPDDRPCTTPTTTTCTRILRPQNTPTRNRSRNLQTVCSEKSHVVRAASHPRASVWLGCLIIVLAQHPHLQHVPAPRLSLTAVEKAIRSAAIGQSSCHRSLQSAVIDTPTCAHDTWNSEDPPRRVPQGGRLGTQQN